MRRYITGLITLTVLLLVTVFTGAPPTSATSTPPACPATTLTRTGVQSSALNATNNGGTWQLTGAVWNKIPSDYPVRSDAWTNGCVIGGEVHGRVARTATRDQWYNGTGGTRYGGEALLQTLTSTPGNWAVDRNQFLTDFEDGYDPNAPRNSTDTLYIDHGHTEWIRDDCVENEGGGTTEGPMSVTVNDSLWDGCFTVFAARPKYSGGAVKNGTGNSALTVTDSLIYSNPQPLGPLYCSDAKVTQGRCTKTSTPNVWLGNHGIWKWSIDAPKTVTITNTIFRLDQASYSSCAPQVWPDGTYTNVTLVWLGAGPYSTAGGCKNVLPPGVTLTTDKSVWDNAKAAWLSATPR